MRHVKFAFIVLAIALALSGCGLFSGDDDGADLSASEELPTTAPTTNFVQPGSESDAPAAATVIPVDDGGLPTALPLPQSTAAPEATVDRSQPQTYVVQSGDVLGLIAERFDVDIAELRRVNGLSGNLIKVGQELTIPAAGGATGGDSGAPAATSAPASPAATSAPAAPVSCPSGSTGHCIQPGDSLTGIAAKYGVTVEALRAANPSIVGDTIRTGQILNIPGSSSGGDGTTPTTAPVPTTETAGTPAPVGSANDADCLAANPEFPYYHEGLCYGSPIGATAVPTSAAADPDEECLAGYILWDDGLCYPIPGATVTPDPDATAQPTTGGGSGEDYGTPPCRDGYVELVATGKCWPEQDTIAATVTPVGQTPTSTPTPTP